MQGIVVDGTRVIWMQSDGLEAEAIGGGPAVSLAPLAQAGAVGPEGLAIGGGNLYALSSADGSLVRMPLGGGTLATLVTRPEVPVALAVDATNLYWTALDRTSTSGLVLQMPLEGGAPTTLATAHLGTLGGIAVDGSNVYFPDLGTSPCGVQTCGAIVKVPIGGGAAVTVASAPSYGYGSTLAVDATSVYFTSARGVFRVTPK